MISGNDDILLVCLFVTLPPDMVDMAQSDNVSVIDVLGMSVDELESMTYTGTSVESTNELVMVCTSDDENGEESLVRNNCLSDEVADGKHEQSDKHDTHYILETERCCTVESKQTTDYRVKRCGIGAAFITQHRPVKDILSANENSDGKKSKATLIEHCTVGSKLQINHHMESQGLVKQYICCYCSKTFKYQSHLLSHVSTHRLTHDEDACFTCDICKHEFRSSSGLRKHRRIHDAIQRHKCFVCAKTFPFASVLAEHERIHSASCLFLCDFCGLGFKQASNMRKHRCLMHELTDTSSCHHCGPDSQCVCPTKSSSASSKFQCPVCLKCFTNKSYKEMHLRVHSGERPYQCQVGICNDSLLLCWNNS